MKDGILMVPCALCHTYFAASDLDEFVNGAMYCNGLVFCSVRCHGLYYREAQAIEIDYEEVAFQEPVCVIPQQEEEGLHDIL